MSEPVLRQRDVSPADDTMPESGEIRAITPDILWARLTARKAPLGGLNVWLIRDGDGWTAVDTGFAGDATLAEWNTLLESRIEGPIKRVICTHCHPDHIGQVGMLNDRFGAPVMMSAIEWARAKSFSDDAPHPNRLTFVEHLRLLGMAPENFQRPAPPQGASAFPARPHLPETFEEIKAGDVLDIGKSKWRVETGAGHSPCPVILFNDREEVVIVGDQLLTKITPHVGTWAEDPDADALGEYYGYLEHARATYPASYLALAGHGPVFRDPGGRAGEIIAHHEDRLDILTRELAAGDKRAADVLNALFGRELDGFNLFMGLTEAHAHLNRLVATGRADRRVDEQGSHLFSARA